MCYCTARCAVISTSLLQLMAIIERQVFDFMGFMWGMIFANFLHIIFVLFAIFGAYQFRSKLLVVYVLWSPLWLAWNSFIICLYLNVGELSRHDEYYILTMGTENRSWWLERSIGCQLRDPLNVTQHQSSGRPLPSEANVTGCLLDYQFVEVIHASVQILLALFGAAFCCIAMHIFASDDDSFDFIGGFDTYSSFQSPGKAAHLRLEPLYANTR